MAGIHGHHPIHMHPVRPLGQSQSVRYTSAGKLTLLNRYGLYIDTLPRY